ncbi:MAG: hypothetical protein RMJ17_04290 [Candidatus Aenigmarchaeota archaeon]|nr:hypothetical protein [Candidatus Aenigmarchaeota archaeon]MDW8149777.1 hypothetical protein [Candidatus Aenigmarchaeota archaeon]
MEKPKIFYFSGFDEIVNSFFKFKYPELVVLDTDNNVSGFLKSKDIMKGFFKGKDVFKSSVSYFISKETEFFIRDNDDHITFFDVAQNYKDYNISIKNLLCTDVTTFSLEDNIRKVLKKSLKTRTPIIFLYGKNIHCSLLPEELFVYALFNWRKWIIKGEEEKKEAKVKMFKELKKEKINFVKNIININNTIDESFTLSKCIKVMLGKRVLTCVTKNGKVLDIRNVYEKIESEG